MMKEAFKEVINALPLCFPSQLLPADEITTHVGGKVLQLIMVDHFYGNGTDGI